MDINNRFSHSIFWSGALATALLLTGCNKSSEPEKRAQEQKTPQSKTATDKSATPTPTPTPVPEVTVVEEQIELPIDTKLADAIREGRNVAAAIDAAIVAIDLGHEADAKAEVTKALTTLAKLEHDRPNVDVIVTLWRGNQELVFLAENILDTIPLLERLTRVEVPVYNREQIAARLEHRKGQAPDTVTKQDKSIDLEMVDANLVYEEVDLPIAITAVHVREAKKLLDEGNLAAAKHALLRAVGSVGVIELIEQAPEYRAQKLVWAAQTAFMNDNMSEAKRLLAAANDLLAPLAKHEDDAQGQTMVNMLLAEMKPLQAALDVGAKPDKNAFARMEHNARSFVRRAALRRMLTARHETERLALVDALMWLEKSETMGLSTAETNTAASRDLMLAEVALTRAAKEAQPSAKPQIDDLHARVAHLITLDTAKSRDPSVIESELRRVIFDMRMLMLDLGVTPPSKKSSPQGG